ncbi:MAG: hypothetical protein ABJC98_08110 [Bacteroidota bacterium]
MSNEKQTDTAGWKSKLEQLDSLQEDSIRDKNISWEKLHDRLHEKPRRNKIVWYWAAACLVLLAGFPWLLKKSSIGPVVKNIVQQKQNPTPVTPVKTTNEAQLPLISSKPFPEKEVIPRTAKSTRYTNKKNKINDPDAIMTIAIKPATANEQVIVHVPDTVVAFTAMISTKKKLPVIHINELGKQEQENARFASRNQWPSFQIKFLNQDNYSGTSLPAGNTAQDMLKIKIPFKN